MTNFSAATSIEFSPLLPVEWLFAFAALAAIIFAVSLWANRRGIIWRALTLGVFLLALANPSLLEENRSYVSDVAVIVLDESPSQNMGERAERSQEAFETLKERLDQIEDLEVRTVNAPSGSSSLAQETRLFEALDQTLADVPQSRRAGVFLITDGQIHDVPQNREKLKSYGPVHALLSGQRRERDRRLVILQAPAYGLVGEDLTVRFKIEDDFSPPGSSASLNITNTDGQRERLSMPLNQEQVLDFTIEHAGQNVFELEVDGYSDELTQANNRAAILVNGVRDRLKVLLVSGQPHAGGRTWRDLLTSDPSVDLVHFTILREPEKLDRTPQRELSLIAFPFRELFEIKLYDFDLIIFDRYRLNDVVPDRYFKNITKFVREGGALLAASGPDYASDRSLYMTSLAEILPSSPTGKIFQEAYIPSLTNYGNRHPVTRILGGASAEKQNWGPWLRQAGITAEKGTDILMKGYQGEPLLILDRIGEGRVAQFTSDHLWLWSRGYAGGGPAAELLRRVVHWLMKEPELDERALDIAVDGRSIRVRASDYGQVDPVVTMTKPDGSPEDVLLMPEEQGWLQTRIEADQLGVYSFETKDGIRRYAVVGNLNPPELQGVRTTEELLKSAMQISGGGSIWLSEKPDPDIRSLGKSRRNFAGYGWLGLRRNQDYSVTGVKTIPAFPLWVSLALLIGLTVFAWWREGKA